MKSQTRPLIKKNAKARPPNLINNFFNTLSSVDYRLAGNGLGVIAFL
jgi:hypothetical protein